MSLIPHRRTRLLSGEISNTVDLFLSSEAYPLKKKRSERELTQPLSKVLKKKNDLTFDADPGDISTK
jgi:hypothetical protein